MKKNIIFLSLIIIIGLYFFGVLKNNTKNDNTELKNVSSENISTVEDEKEIPIEQNIKEEKEQKNEQIEIIDPTKFYESFDGDYVLEETGKMSESVSQNWWVNSGAFLFVSNGTGKTIIGDLKKGEKWQEKYKDYNSSETDTGYHPQNIFRLVTKLKWKNLKQECYYKIHRYILSKDKGRSESNGILLFNRYQDGDNLYYTGLRVDGSIIIKKKKNGEYYTMAQKAYYPGVYGRKKNPNLLPLNRWIGVRSEVQDNANGTVSIKVYIDKNRSGNWNLALIATDNGKSFGGAAIKNTGYAGIRTDFMDVEFDDYKIEEIK